MARLDNYTVKDWKQKTAWKFVSSGNKFVVKTPDGKVKEANLRFNRPSKSFLMKVIEKSPKYVMRGKI